MPLVQDASFRYASGRTGRLYEGPALANGHRPDEFEEFPLPGALMAGAEDGSVILTRHVSRLFVGAGNIGFGLVKRLRVRIVRRKMSATAQPKRRL